MVKSRQIAALAAMVLMVALQPQANAAPSNKSSWIPSQNCVLSIPTTDTGVRPRGNGFRNEGATNAFVICPANPAGSSSPATSVSIFARSFDGLDHTFNCTFTNAVDSPVYSTKPVTVTAGGGTASVTWTPADVGGGSNFSNYISAVTCILPPGASIQATYVAYPVEIGS